MRTSKFERPQRQSGIGVLLIFLSFLYKFGRVFWAVLIIQFIAKNINWLWVGVGVFFVVPIAFFLSYLYYRRFLFYVNLEKQIFVLKKGLFAKEELQISFDKIQQVDTQQNLVQRMLNVYKLVIDTAGGNEKEVIIHAISKPDAEELAQILMEYKAKVDENSDAIQQDLAPENTPTDISWDYRIGVRTLLKIGITSNQLRGAVLILAFFSSLYQEFESLFEEETEKLYSYVNEIPDPLENVSLLIGVLVVLLFVSMLVTMIEVFIKFFNLKIHGSSTHLSFEMGLNNNKKSSLQPRRAQVVERRTNPLQKALGLYELKISLANNTNSEEKSKIKLPGLKHVVMDKIIEFLYHREAVEKRHVFRPHAVLLYRKYLISSFLLLAFWIVFLIFPTVFSLDIALLFSGIYILCIGLFQWISFRDYRLAFTEDFLYKKHGVWTKVETRVELYKLQSISVAQPYFYKNKNLVNLTFHTAGGDVSFRALDRSVLDFVNYSFYKIETSQKAWM